MFIIHICKVFFTFHFIFNFVSTKRRGPKQNLNLICKCRSCGLLSFRFRYPMLACMHVGKISLLDQAKDSKNLWPIAQCRPLTASSLHPPPAYRDRWHHAAPSPPQGSALPLLHHPVSSKTGLFSRLRLPSSTMPRYTLLPLLLSSLKFNNQANSQE